MSFLPQEALTLKGGCFCSAIRFTVSIPELSHRPLVPNALPTPTAPDDPESPTTPTRLPTIDLDHCESCRRACGSLLMCWLICPMGWVSFELLARSSPTRSSHTSAEVAKPSEQLLQQTYLAHYLSSEDVHRSFCGRCGTGISYHYSGERPHEWDLGPTLDITLGSLDKESLEMQGVRPDRHSWWEDGVSWIKELTTKGAGALLRHPTGSASNVVGG